jgi:hypothetical protein
MMDKDKQKFIEKIAGDDWMIWDEENGDGLDTDLIWEWFSTEMRKKWQEEVYLEVRSKLLSSMTTPNSDGTFTINISGEIVGFLDFLDRQIDSLKSAGEQNG